MNEFTSLKSEELFARVSQTNCPEANLELRFRTDQLYWSLRSFLKIEAEIGSAAEEIEKTKASGNETDPRNMFPLMDAFAEFERVLIEARTEAGLIADRNLDENLGRPRAITPSKIDHAHKLIEAGESLSEVARTLDVDKSNLHRALKTVPAGDLGRPKVGRQRVITPSKIDHAKKLISAGETMSDVARTLGVNRSTLHRALKVYDGDNLGRKISITPEKIDHAQKLISAGERVSEVARTLDVDKSNLHRALKSARTEEEALSARKRGAQIGRPRSIPPSEMDNTQRLVHCRRSVAYISKILGVDRSTLRSFLKIDRSGKKGRQLLLTPSKIQHAKKLIASGKSMAHVAKELGIDWTTYIFLEKRPGF